MVLPWTVGSSSDKLKGGGGETAGTITTKRCTKQLHQGMCNFKSKCLQVVLWGGGRRYFHFVGVKETFVHY